MKNTIFRRMAALLLLLSMLFSVSCGSAETGGTTHLSFRSASSYDYLKTLSGTTVSINGYLATSSPADGSFLFLMNLPYQSCPFCKPNTSELSNTIEVYPKKNRSFDYTTQAVQVTGTLVVAQSSTDSFTDSYGYVFNFKIVDAEYVILTDEDLSTEIARWQTFAASGIVNKIYEMYDYVNFLCAWNTYYVDTYEDADGTTHTGFYLYASDAMQMLTEENGQYHYGYADGYFDSIKAEIQKMEGEAFVALAENIESAKALAAKALGELTEGHYTCEYQYVSEFGTYDNIYTIDLGEELGAEMDALYLDFSNWLGNWEM